MDFSARATYSSVNKGFIYFLIFLWIEFVLMTDYVSLVHVIPLEACQEICTEWMDMGNMASVLRLYVSLSSVCCFFE